MANSVKVRISFTVDIDPQAWATEYATGAGAGEVREDVRRYVEQATLAQLAEQDLLAD